MPTVNKIRCKWAETNPYFFDYHDKEWGVPLHNDRRLFELLNLEGAQAGLSWLTILKRRQDYRRAFDNFDANKMSLYDDQKRKSLLADEGIIRNRLKINAAIENAKAYIKIQNKFGSFDTYIWHFTNSKSLAGNDHNKAVIISETMSKDLKARGFKFVGPTICYAFMQAIGIVNDHEKDCFRFEEIEALTP